MHAEAPPTATESLAGLTTAIVTVREGTLASMIAIATV